MPTRYCRRCEGTGRERAGISTSDLDPEKTPAGRVRARLRTDASLAGHPIQVVEAGERVYLRGRVPTQAQADWAGRLARQTVGVPAVVNEIAVGP